MLTHGELMTRQAVVAGFLSELQDAEPFQNLWRSALAQSDVSADLRAAHAWVQSRDRPTSEYVLSFLQAFDPRDLAAGPHDPDPIEHLARHFASGGHIANAVGAWLSEKGPLGPLAPTVVGHLWAEVARDMLGSDSPFHDDKLLIAREARLNAPLDLHVRIDRGTSVADALKELSAKAGAARKLLLEAGRTTRGTIPDKRLGLHSDWGRWLVRHYVLEVKRKALSVEVFGGDDRRRDIGRGISGALRILGIPVEADQP